MQYSNSNMQHYLRLVAGGMRQAAAAMTEMQCAGGGGTWQCVALILLW
jgi:hypothetical protein